MSTELHQHGVAYRTWKGQFALPMPISWHCGDSRGGEYQWAIEQRKQGYRLYTERFDLGPSYAHRPTPVISVWVVRNICSISFHVMKYHLH